MKTVTIKTKIKSCQSCSFFKEGDRQSTDGFDSGNDWYCTHSGKDIMIAGFVEWHEVDKTEIPEWCPIAVKKKKKNS